MALKKNSSQQNKENNIDKKLFRKHWFQYWWVRALTLMGSVVLFCTVYALILPALTLEQDKASAEAGLDLGILEALTGGSAQETESTEPAPVDLTELEPVDITEPPTTEPEPTPDLGTLVRQLISTFVESLFSSISRLFAV